MIKAALKRKRAYWLCVSITAALCYGFTLTNFSIGVDDERFSIFSTNGEWAAQGRWGSYITKYIFNSYEFLPFWRDFIAVLLMVLGVTFWCYLLEKYSNQYFTEDSLIIFSCIAISFPYIASAFILEMLMIEIGLIITFTAISLLLAARFFIKDSEMASIKHKWLYLLGSVLSLTYAISFYETACIFFLTGIFIFCILIYISSELEEKFKNNKYVWIFFSLFSILVISVILWKIIGILIVKSLSMEMSQYTSNMIVYDKNNLVQSIFSFISVWFKMIVDNAKNDISDLTFLFSAIIIIVLTLINSIKRKNLILLLLGIGCILSVQSMYFLTGNIYLVKRSLYPTCIFVGFAFALLAATFHNSGIAKSSLKYLPVILAVFIIFYQSKNINEVFFNDYIRYQRDVSTMNTIALQIQDVQNGEDKPIAFVGALDEYNLKLGDIEGHTIFMWDRVWSVQQELSSARIFDFMKMHGYDFIQAKDINENKLKEEVSGMSSYPHDGYIKDCGDYIIVRIGKSQLEKTN